MRDDSMEKPRRTNLLKFAAATIACVVAIGVFWGYVSGSNERALEAEREAPVKAPLRVSTVGGEPTITLDPAGYAAAALKSFNCKRRTAHPNCRRMGRCSTFRHSPN